MCKYEIPIYIFYVLEIITKGMGGVASIVNICVPMWQIDHVCVGQNDLGKAAHLSEKSIPVVLLWMRKTSSVRSMHAAL
jgi:hypothetical protein